MLQLSKTLVNLPVMSLRTGVAMGTAVKPLINPSSLKVEGWIVKDKFERKSLILLTQDVRDIIPRGIVVDDHDVLSEPDELVRMKEVIEQDFNLIDKQVVTEAKRNLGKVEDFAVDMTSMFVQKIYVSQSFLKSLSSGQLSIDRNQIVEITNKKIVVREATEKISQPATAPAVG